MVYENTSRHEILGPSRLECIRTALTLPSREFPSTSFESALSPKIPVKRKDNSLARFMFSLSYSKTCPRKVIGESRTPRLDFDTSQVPGIELYVRVVGGEVVAVQ